MPVTITNHMVTQADFTLAACRSRTLSLSVTTDGIWRRRRAASRSAFSSSAVLMHLAGLRENEVIEEQRILSRHNRISLADFSFNCNAFGDKDCLLFFRFKKTMC
ncbi:unnamed protein product [Chondrus crispus]|uniref:Uncharacterized protein n=1 Tax=Chondrus crispus TaxID=2769 RepID=R7QNH3_CHOCR|nr:unnamed protein product [Chondrus crispus]CDF38935.1 unnamed protein product [Chondrus crispus]|eukprot:XP_005718840.1 unnamed protein product [Chondrus crispus]